MGREAEREGEEHRCERETSVSYLLYVLRPGTEPTTQACTLTGNQTSDLLLLRDDLQPTEPHWSGHPLFFAVPKPSALGIDGLSKQVSAGW